MTQPIEEILFNIVVVPDTADREGDIKSWFKNQLGGLGLEQTTDTTGRTVFTAVTNSPYEALDTIVSDSESVPVGVEVFLVKETDGQPVIDDRAVKIVKSEEDHFEFNTDAYVDMFYYDALEGE